MTEAEWKTGKLVAVTSLYVCVCKFMCVCAGICTYIQTKCQCMCKIYMYVQGIYMVVPGLLSLEKRILQGDLELL